MATLTGSTVERIAATLTALALTGTTQYSRVTLPSLR